jgi:hypothetical protein
MNKSIIKPAPVIIFLLLMVFVWFNAGWTVAGKANILIVSPTLTAAAPTLTPGPTSTVTITTTPTTRPTPTLTPLPPEYLETPDQTIGILFGAVFLVIIIVGGTFFTIRRKR